MSEEIQENVEEGRVYELAYLFVPTLTEDVVSASFGNLKNLLEKHGATFVAEELPKTVELAYEMNRTILNKKTWFTSGYFGWIKFEIDPSAIKDVEEKLKRDEEIIRYMIIKTVRESTLATKKPVREYRKKTETIKSAGDEPVVEMNKEEVDKQIDAMIAE